MSRVLEPLGPLPAVVYWRRRAAAVAVAVLALVLAIWLVSRLVGGGGTEAAAQPGNTSGTDGPDGAPAPASSATPVPGATAPEPGGPPNPAEPTAADPGSSTAGLPPAPAPAPAPGEPAAVAVCADPALSVRAEVAEPTYLVGEQPVFRILITNTGKAPCNRNLDAALQSVTVYAADDTRLWSSNDCFPAAPTDDAGVTLDPGVASTFSVKWSSTTSEPTCTAERNPAPAGAYTAVSTLGPMASPPAEFELVEK